MRRDRPFPSSMPSAHSTSSRPPTGGRLLALPLGRFGLRPEHIRWFIAAGALGLVAALLGIGAMLGALGRDPEPACSDASAVIAQVNATIQQGQLAYAQQLADSALGAQAAPLCPAAQAALATLRYQAALDEALVIAPPGTGRAEADKQALLAYLEAERVADRYALPTTSRTPALVVTGQAYSAGKYLLSQGAFLRAWQAGQVGPTQLRAVDTYYSILFNAHQELLDTNSPAARQEALALLRTADAIAQRYQLPGRGEAHAQLLALLGADQTTWPAARAHTEWS